MIFPIGWYVEESWTAFGQLIYGPYHEISPCLFLFILLKVLFCVLPKNSSPVHTCGFFHLVGDEQLNHVVVHRICCFEWQLSFLLSLLYVLWQSPSKEKNPQPDESFRIQHLPMILSPWKPGQLRRRVTETGSGRDGEVSGSLEGEREQIISVYVIAKLNNDNAEDVQ